MTSAARRPVRSEAERRGEARAKRARPAREDRGKLAVVWAEFNAVVTEEMRDRAVRRAKELGYEPAPVWKVAGSYDLPFAVDRALARKDVAGAVAIGCIITGETKHDEIIAHAAAKSLLDVSIARGKPVGLGLTGPGQTFEQAKERVDRAEAAVEAVHALLALS